MVINIMVGIRLAGGRAMSEPHRNVEPYDFVMKEKFSVLPKTGMVDKKQASLCAVRFIDYAPMVFRRIRAIFGIDSLLYIRSVGPEQLLGNLILGNLSSLSELVSEGKSGSLFYYTTDGKFMIKTVSKETASFMRSILFDYYKHVSTCTNTMLTRFCGLHAIRLKDKSGQILGRKGTLYTKKTAYQLVIVEITSMALYLRYSVLVTSLYWDFLVCRDSTVARKDNDMTRDGELASHALGKRFLRDFLSFHKTVGWYLICCVGCVGALCALKIEIGQERKKLFLDQLALDATFLRDHDIMDYSLLLGISYANRSQGISSFERWRSPKRSVALGPRPTSDLFLSGSDNCGALAVRARVSSVDRRTSNTMLFDVLDSLHPQTPISARTASSKSVRTSRDLNQCDDLRELVGPCILSVPLDGAALMVPFDVFAGSDFERPFWNKDLGGMHSSDRTKLYYVGIIDILTHWNAKKKLEHVARVLQCVFTAVVKS
ncbi:hypothetical protein ACSSS7_003538 [Eimeria intestinalis]